jgi:hypothetical protein
MQGAYDGFLTRFNQSGSGLLYSTFVGGAGVDDPRGIALDRRGNAYLTGYTDSPDFATTPGAYATTLHNPDEEDLGDAFVMKIGRTDCDADGVPDTTDNCPETANASQSDADGDGIGDACDPDPGSTPGCDIRGHGVVSGSGGVWFYLDVSTGDSVSGKLNYRRNRPRLYFRSTDIASALVDGTRATIRGEGKAGSSRLTFTVEVDDLGPRHLDTFHIELSNGESAGGQLRSGRIDVTC